jgi:hypothetical protein
MRTCFQCGQEIPAEQTILREDECPHCSSDLHACRNCRFYDPASSNQCSEPQADWITAKERANFCEYFDFSGRSGPREGAPDSPSARDRFKKLFRD